VIQVETHNETNTAQALFISEVGEALDRACVELESTCEGVNRDFAQEVEEAARKYGMGREQVGKVLTDFGRNSADIATGPGLRLPSLNVIDVLLSAYETVLGEEEAHRIRACIENEDKEA
jgi:hypothetical protein